MVSPSREEFAPGRMWKSRNTSGRKNSVCSWGGGGIFAVATKCFSTLPISTILLVRIPVLWKAASVPPPRWLELQDRGLDPE